MQVNVSVQSAWKLDAFTPIFLVGLQVMDMSFDVRPVDSATVRPAFAIAVLASPGLTLARFRKASASVRTGVLTGLFDRRGYVHGLFRARVLAGGGILCASDLILSDVIAACQLKSIVAALARYAKAGGCDQLTVALRPDMLTLGYGLVNLLEDNGFDRDSALLTLVV